MLRISRHSRHTPAQALERAVDYFGEKGEGLALSGRNPCCASFEGAGGYVTVTAAAAPKGCEVGVVTGEFEHQARRFLETL